MAKDLIYMVNTAASTVGTGATINLPVVARRRGCVCMNGDNSVVLNRPGYYKVDAVVTFTSSTTGDATVLAYKGFNAIAGMTATETIGTATTEVKSIALSGIVRVVCGEVPTILTLHNSGIPLTTSNVGLTVEYLG